MKNCSAILAGVVGFALLATALPMAAHHSFAAEYDRTRTITVTGSMTKLEWTNPHARIYVMGADETGKTDEAAKYRAELAAWFSAQLEKDNAWVLMWGWPRF